MIRKRLKQTTTIALGASSILVLIGLYTALSYRQHKINPQDRTVPTFYQMYEGIQKATTPHGKNDSWLMEDISATGMRLLLSFLFSILLATSIGILGCFSGFRAFLAPILSFFSQIQPTAIVSVFFAFLPTLAQLMPWTEQYNLFIAVIVFGTAPALAERIHLAIRDIPSERIYKAYTLGGSHLEIVFSIIFREILPHIIDGIRGLFGPMLVYLIAAEMLYAGEGFGYRIRLQSRLANMDVVFPYIILLANFGYLVNYLFGQIQKRLCSWFNNGN